MHVELSEHATEKLEQLVDAGEYPSVAAAVEAAVNRLAEPDFEYSAEELAELLRPAYESVARGLTRPADGVAQELRSLIAARTNQRNQ